MSTAVHLISPNFDDAFAPPPPLLFNASPVNAPKSRAAERSRKPRAAKPTSSPTPPSSSSAPTPASAQPRQSTRPLNSASAQPRQSTRPLHFIAATLRKQGATVAGCARRLGIAPAEAAAQARPDADLSLSQLYAWRAALDVPLAELLPLEDVVPDPIRNRALLLRTMKTARLLQDLTRGARLESVAASLVDQLIELMPELAEVPAWPSVGQSRAPRELGAGTRRVDSDFSRFIEERS